MQPAQHNGRRRRLLIIDDEPRLLRSYGLVLGAEHDVVLASGGEEALAQVKCDPNIDLILCDLQMPGLDGVAFYESLESIAPSLSSRVVFSTGGVFQPKVQAFLQTGDFPVLEKPVRVEELLSLLQS